MTDRPMTEREFQRTILMLFRMYGWKVAHFDASVRVVGKGADRRFVGDKGSAGYPDITATRGGRLIFAELKTDVGRVTKTQQDWLDSLAMSEAEVYVWRPQDLAKIQRVINRDPA